MVVFTCGYCGESVQKPKVEKHYTTTKCRNRNPNLSCMDCFKDFLGNAYEEHTKCITEEERYSGKGFVAKEKKGERKQSTWIDLVQSVLDEQKNAPRNVLRIIETISKHNNTPRKKPKFFNFVKNVCGAKTGAKDIEQAWELISPKLAALSNANQRNPTQTKDTETEQNGSQEENGHDDTNSNSKDEISQNSQDETNELEENSKENNDEPPEDKKLSKKQRKEEKKQKKYEAELQSAEAPPEEEEDEEADTKKGKKKKNRTESLSEEQQEGKKNKRKRQDTVNSVSSNQEITENMEVQNVPVKAQKKKVKVDEELEESMCLHDQNVAKISELAMTDKFNWHAVIISVLQKKDNELPFKRLQKKVLAEYSESTGREIDDRIADKFIKKLKSAPKVRVDKNRVMLIE